MARKSERTKPLTVYPQYANEHCDWLTGVERKWKRSDFCESDFEELMNPLTTLIFFPDFHQVISALKGARSRN